MAKVRLIDTKEKFLLEIDGTEIPYVSTYEIGKSVQGFLTMKIVLSVNEVEELGIETDKEVRIVRKLYSLYDYAEIKAAAKRRAEETDGECNLWVMTRVAYKEEDEHE